MRAFGFNALKLHIFFSVFVVVVVKYEEKKNQGNHQAECIKKSIQNKMQITWMPSGLWIDWKTLQ